MVPRTDPILLLSFMTNAIQLSNSFSITGFLEIYVIIFSGQELSEPFWNLPSKRYYPDYYKEIKNPLSLNQIGKKLKVQFVVFSFSQYIVSVL